MQPTQNPLIDKVIEQVREGVGKTQITPVFFLGGENLRVVDMEFTSEKSKDAVAALVRQLAAAERTDFVLFVCESWTLKPEDAADFLANKARYREVCNHPRAIEVVMFSLETQLGTTMATAEILPGRVLGPVEWQAGASFSGRFTNFLPPRGPMGDA